MYLPQILPSWTNRDACFRCHISFSTFTRKHHCRACGETFCSACSSKSSPLFEFGVEDEVRVCESCYDRLITTGSVYSPESSPTGEMKEKDQDELDEQGALQLAISLSQSEAEEKERQKELIAQQYAISNMPYPPTPLGSAPIIEQDDNEQKSAGGNGELAKYLDRTYWEGRTQNESKTVVVNQNPMDNYVRDDEINAFINTVNEHINNIKRRMLSNQQRGRNISNDTAVQSVFVILQHMYPELHRFIKLLDDKQAYYESLQDKLGQLKDAREALNALRDDYLENKKRQAFERERQRQVQLAVKLDDMRKKKQDYLEYQRQMHLQRLAEQEAEMQARLNQQRLYAQQREQQNQIDYRINQIPNGPPTSTINYYPNQNLISPQLTSNVFSMGPLSDAIPQSGSPTLSQIQQLYPTHSSMQPNEQTLISFD